MSAKLFAGLIPESVPIPSAMICVKVPPVGTLPAAVSPEPT